MYGISQNPDTMDYILIFQNNIFCKVCCEKYTNINYKWCKPCQINWLKNNFTNWTSGNEKIDDFIQEKQLNSNSYNDVVFEWIPYNQFNELKETGKNGSITVYSAIWKNGPLHKEDMWSNNYTRDSNKEVALKCLHNLQNPVDYLINEV